MTEWPEIPYKIEEPSLMPVKFLNSPNEHFIFDEAIKITYHPAGHKSVLQFQKPIKA
jgi:hypothetical protein